MFVIKNAEIKQRELTEKEKKDYATFDYELIPETTKGGTDKKEKPLIITVKKE